MTENMKKFLAVVSEKEELREKIGKMDKDALIALAKTLNIPLTDADFEQPVRELSDNELDLVTGAGDCFCAIGGGGTKKGECQDRDGLETCACVVAGFGYYGDGTIRCGCTMGGSGID